MPNLISSKFSRVYTTFILLLFAVLFFGFFSNPPNGNTGAPGDALCTNCHSPGNPNGFDGEVIIENFPATIIAGTEYSLTAKVTNPNGMATRAGFQAVVLDASNNNIGDLEVSGSNPTTSTSGSREYVEHNPGLNFPGSNEVTWDFTWTAPTGPDGMVITIWAAGNITNGNGNTSGDFVVTTNVSGVLDATNMPLEVEIVSSTNVSCNGGNDGAASAAASGGTGPYTYLWSNNASGPTVSNLTAGTYTVTATDDLNATATAEVTISEPPILEASIVNQTNITCTTATGSATAQGSGGTPPYFYNWPSGGTNATETGLSGGSHTVTVTDDNQCLTTTTVVILEDITPPEVEAGPDQELNCNVSTVILDGSGSTSGPTYVYQWTTFDGLLCGGETTPLASACAPGTYTLTVTCTENGCSATDFVVVTEIPEVELSISGEDVSCFAGNDGSIDLTVSGGQAPFDYDWDDDSLDGMEDPINLTAGSYCVTVTDNVGCADFICVTIAQPSALVIQFIPSNTTCFGSCDGSINLNVTGGEFPYSYDWSNGDTVEDPTGLCANDYTVTVTDANDCTAIETITILEPEELLISGTETNTTCNGICDGAISVTVSGGTPSYTFLWTGPDGYTSTNQNIDVLCPGDYTLELTDLNFCTSQMTFTVTEPDDILITGTITDALCFETCTGAIDITVTGGTAPYTYEWDTTPTSTSEDLDGLCAGDYTVTVTDANDCSSTSTITVGEPSEITISISGTDASCNESCDGSLTATVSGGTGSFLCVWNTNPPQSEHTAVNLCAGSYTITATDQNNCLATAVGTVNEPLSLEATTSVSSPSCNGGCDGSIDLSVSGGTAPFTYAWDNGLPETEDQDNLCAGTYSVTVTDDNGCSIISTTVVDEPSELSGTAEITNASCNGICDGSIDITVTGGTPGYTYLWSTGSEEEDILGLCAAEYTVTVTDANNCTETHTFTVTESESLDMTLSVTNTSCNGSCDGSIIANASGGTGTYSYLWNTTPPQTGQTAVNLCSGDYEVTVTDENGCSAAASGIVTEPAPFEISADLTNVTCNGLCDGAIDLNVTGGTAPYSYDWGDGSTTEDRTDLCAGQYTVVITDDNGCTVISGFTITEPDPLTASATTTNVTCNGVCDGTVNVTVSGGTAPYSYDWSGPCEGANPMDVCAGNFTVTITDANGCTTSLDVTINEPSPLLISEEIEHLLCNGDCNGSIDISVSGGTAPYTYMWSTGSGEEDILGLCAGSYSVTVTDANDCEVVEIYALTEPPSISLSVTSTNETASGANDGTATANPAGGTGVFTYIWDDPSNQITQTAVNLAPGTYCVTVTDENGCTEAGCAPVNPFECNLEGFVTTTDPACAGGDDGTAIATIAGGEEPYTYNWSSGGTSNPETGLSAGVYTVTITDAENCTFTTTFIIGEPEQILVTASVTDATCNGLCDGIVNLTVTGGAPPYAYDWSGPCEGPNPMDVCAGTFTVTVTDANGCTTALDVTINEPDILELNAELNHVLCNGDCNGSVDLSVMGGTAPYTFEWSTGSGEEDILGLCAGSYSVTVTDANGCTAEAVYAIVEPPALNLTISSTNETATGANDGTATVSTSGGTPGYTYLWDNGETSSTITGLAPGDYCVTVTDSNGCTATLCTTVFPFGCNLVLNLSDENFTCPDFCNGTIDLTVTGGTAPYSYLWSNDFTGEDPVDLCEGDYTVIVTDDNGCTAIAGTSVNVSPEMILEFEISASNCGLPCSGTIDLTVTNGTPPLSFVWLDGLANVISTEEDLVGVCPDMYTAIVTDANGCMMTATTPIVEPEPIVATAVVTDATCFGQCDGTIELIVSGGVSPYTFIWTGGLPPMEDQSEVCAGTYVVTITDNEGCTVLLSVTVGEPADMILETETTDASCFVACDGSTIISVSGGTAPYIFDGPTEDLCAGDYTIIVTDANGCTSTVDFTIVEPSELFLTATTTNVSCLEACDGTATYTAAGGTPPYSFSGPFEDICAGTYTTTITDANGCTATDAFTISEPPELIATVITVGNEMETMMDGFIEITTAGGTAPYTYEWWLDGVLISTDEDPTGLSGGVYELVVTDANGCEYTETIFVDNIVAISQLELNQGVQVFPNPTSGILHVKFDLSETSKITLEVFDYTGRLVNTQQKTDIYTQLVPLDLSHYADGVYTLKIKVDDVFLIEKVVKYSW